MRHSFIITTYNILPYIDRCLDSLIPCLRPGDAVIVVDDGSTDGTAERVLDRLSAGGFGEGVALTPVVFGTNTIGGVGIAGNTGMAEALADPACEAVFFVDGDDWLEPEGFLACRAAFEASGADILIGNYGEYDESAKKTRKPADTDRWARLAQAGRGKAATRDLALSMIAVPWRKFYRADFLRRHRPRFPEGRFFFEDNPFHWEICLKAEGIAFHDRLLCWHRINRPGQTMASTGHELTAFFDHYDTIRAGLPADIAPQTAAAAVDWLINNMAWHLDRLKPEAYWAYAGRAARTLCVIPEEVWAISAPRFARTVVGGVAAALRAGDVAAVVGIWINNRQTAALQRIEQRLSDLLRQTGDLARQTADRDGRMANHLGALTEIARFAALTASPAGDSGPDAAIPPGDSALGQAGPGAGPSQGG